MDSTKMRLLGSAQYNSEIVKCKGERSTDTARFHLWHDIPPKSGSL